ncbi:MAG: hypothetical protein LBG47_03190 [Prevotellaceae bacterium]|jgi:hypothetical protein|nr:hypothetical protein [Prevotellaceae bacterium]
MNTKALSESKITKKLINIPAGVKTMLTIQAAALDMNLTKYIEQILVQQANDEEDKWLAPFFNEPDDYLSDEEAQAKLEQLGWV